MLNSRDLIDLGVPPNVAKGFVATVFPTPATASAAASATSAAQSAANQAASYTPTATPTGGGQGAGPTKPGPQLEPAGAPTSYTGTSGTTSPVGGGGGAPGGTTSAPPVDWHTYLTDWGFPPEVVDQLTNIFRTYSDPSQAQAAALAYIRGTDWYTKTFPGIQEGEKLGLVGNEADYRAYVNQVNQLYRNYYNRDVTSSEVAGFLKGGLNTSTVGNHLQGQALVNANRGDWQYQLGAFDEKGQASEGDLSQYGDFLSGIGNMVGPQLQARLQKAQQRFQTIFQGSLASPSLSMLANGRLAAPSLGAGKTPDIGS